MLETSFTLLWTPDLDMAASYKASMPPLIPCLQCEGIGGCPGLRCTDSGFSRKSDVLEPYLDTPTSPQQSKRVSIFNIALLSILALPFHLCTFFGDLCLFQPTIYLHLLLYLRLLHDFGEFLIHLSKTS